MVRRSQNSGLSLRIKTLLLPEVLKNTGGWKSMAQRRHRQLVRLFVFLDDL